MQLQRNVRTASSLRTRGHDSTLPYTDFNLYKILLLLVVSSIFSSAHPITPSYLQLCISSYSLCHACIYLIDDIILILMTFLNLY